MRFTLRIVDLVRDFVTVRRASYRYSETLGSGLRRFTSFRVLCNAGDPNCALSCSHRWAVVREGAFASAMSLKERPSARVSYALSNRPFYIVSYLPGLEDLIGVEGRVVERVDGAIISCCFDCLHFEESRF